MTRYRIVLGESGGSDGVLDWLDGVVDEQSDSVDLMMTGTELGVTAVEAAGVLQTARRRLERDHPSLSVTVESMTGGALERIVGANGPRAASSRPAASTADDVLVLGAAHPSPLLDVLTGWLPQRIAAHATIPVVVVPDRWDHGTGRVVVGVDADTSDAAVLVAGARARAAGRELLLVRAWQVPTVTTPYGNVFLDRDSSFWEHEAERLVGEATATARLRFPGLSVRSEVHEGAPAHVLAAVSVSAMLVVVGRRHHTVVGGTLFGSVGQQLLRWSTAPVCMVPPGASGSPDGTSSRLADEAEADHDLTLDADGAVALLGTTPV